MSAADRLAAARRLADAAAENADRVQRGEITPAQAWDNTKGHADAGTFTVPDPTPGLN